MSRLSARLIHIDRRPMFNVVRRAPSSIARSSSSFPAFSRYSRPVNVREGQRCLPRLVSLRTAKSPLSHSAWRQSPAPAAVEDEAVEGEIEQEVFSQAPPSDEQLNQNARQVARHGPVTKFAELAERGMVCQAVVDTITKRMGLETMTEVQSKTISISLKGQDILAQARTGTGKTLAFLIPLLQNIINVDPGLERRRVGRMNVKADIRAIVISPTRELAEQIAVEARKVTEGTGVIVQTAVGGSLKGAGLRKILSEGCHILVGTPGRLNDILSDPNSRVRAPNLSCFVLDEADRLLDAGFAPEIQNIQNHLPRRSEVDRQTLLYSATVPREVMQVVRQTMKPDFQFIRTVQEGEQQTHEKVPQKLVNAVGLENYMPALLELCKREMSRAADAPEGSGRPFKAIVYFSSTADTSLAAAVLNNLRNPGKSVFHQGPLYPAKIIEMHARLTQQQRTRAADSFRQAQSGIMLSSDVTARGMDFPNVTHVIQMGLPPSEEQYIHRLGRTARGDKTGEGWIIVSNMENSSLRHKLPNMPLQRDSTLETARVDMKTDAQLPEHAAKTLTQVGDAMKMVPRQQKAAAYMAALGMFSWMNNKEVMIAALNDRARYGWAMEQPPAVSRTLASKLGLSRVPGINIGFEERGPSYGLGERDQSMQGFRGRGDSAFGERAGQGRGGSFGGRTGQGRGGYGSTPDNRDRPSNRDRPYGRGYGSDRRGGGGGDRYQRSSPRY